MNLPYRCRSLLSVPVLVAAAALFAGTVDVSAGGTIDSTDATIDAGAAPSRGAVLVDAASAPAPLPPLFPVPLPPAMPDPVGGAPRAADRGDGSLGAFRAASDVTLTGGDYDYTTYVVEPDVTVTYTSAVRIRSTGAVSLDGCVTTQSAGAFVEIQCGGDLSIRARTVFSTPGIKTTGASAPITLVVGGRLLLDSPGGFQSAALSAVSGAVSADVAGAATVGGGSFVNTSSGDVRFVAGGTLVVREQATVSTDGGTLFLRSASESVSVEESSLGAASGDVHVEARGSVFVHGGSSVAAWIGGVSLRAYGGSVSVAAGSTVESDGGGLDVEATSDVTVAGFSSLTAAGDEELRVVAHGGTVTLGDRAAAAEIEDAQDQSEIRHDRRGSVLVHALRTVRLTGDGGISAADGDVVVRAGGDVLLTGTRGVDASRRADVQAAGALLAHPDPRWEPSDGPTLDGASVTLRAGAGGISLATSRIAAASGDLTILSGAHVALRGDLEATGELSVRAVEGGIDATDRTVATASWRSETGGVLLESWSAPITLERSVVTSGDARSRSGNVTVVVHRAAPEGAPPAAPHEDLLVTRAAIRRAPASPTESSLRVQGFAGGGLRGIAADTPASIRVGDRTVSAVRRTTGRGTIRYTDLTGDVVLDVVPPARGQGRTQFSLRVRGDVRGFIDTRGSGTLVVELGDAVVAGRSEVVLDRGRFALGTGRGRLVAPRIYVLGASGTVRGHGRDRLVVRAAAVLDDAAPGAPDSEITFGGALHAAVSGSAFASPRDGGPRDGSPRDDRWVARDPAPGVRSVTIDRSRQTTTITLDRVDLGVVGRESSIDAALALRIGADSLESVLRLRRRGARLRY